jgi:hypothetical protein
LGITLNVSLSGTEQERRIEIGNRNTAQVATNNMTEDADLDMFCKSESSKNKKQHTSRFENIHVTLNNQQWTVL